MNSNCLWFTLICFVSLTFSRVGFTEEMSPRECKVCSLVSHTYSWARKVLMTVAIKVPLHHTVCTNLPHLFSKSHYVALWLHFTTVALLDKLKIKQCYFPFSTQTFWKVQTLVWSVYINTRKFSSVSYPLEARFSFPGYLCREGWQPEQCMPVIYLALDASLWYIYWFACISYIDLILPVFFILLESLVFFSQILHSFHELIFKVESLFFLERRGWILDCWNFFLFSLQWLFISEVLKVLECYLS